MRGQRKIKGQLINEFKNPRQRIIRRDRSADKRKQIEEALWASENYYRTLVENLPQKIFLKDKNSVYLSCNENYSRDLRIRPDEIMGKKDYDFYSKELAKKYRADDKRIMESGKTEEIEEGYIQDGKEEIVHTIKTPIKDEKGKIVGILGIFWDITERKHADDDLKKYREQLEEMVEKRAAELRMSNEQLQREITDRRRTEEVLRESGRQLADRLGSFHPEMKVLYMSGYTDNDITHHGVLEKGMNYIQKPFTVDGLARKVREVLDKGSKSAA